MSELNKEEQVELSKIESWNRLVTNPDFTLFEQYIENEIEIMEKRARDLSKSPGLDNSIASSTHQFAADRLRSLLNRKKYIRRQYAQYKKEKLL